MTTKQQAAAITQEWEMEIIHLMADMGAKKIRDEEHLQAWELQTVAGRLELTLPILQSGEDPRNLFSLFSRFDQPKTARSMGFYCNEYSGKWNWHLGSASRSALASAVNRVRIDLCQALTPKGTPLFCLTHEGVNVYHVHKEGYGQGRVTCYWYSTDNRNSVSHKAQTFDIRDRGMPEVTSNKYYKPSMTPAQHNESFYLWENDARAFLRSLIQSQRIGG